MVRLVERGALDRRLTSLGDKLTQTPAITFFTSEIIILFIFSSAFQHRSMMVSDWLVCVAILSQTQ